MHFFEINMNSQIHIEIQTHNEKLCYFKDNYRLWNIVLGRLQFNASLNNRLAIQLTGIIIRFCKYIMIYFLRNSLNLQHLFDFYVIYQTRKDYIIVISTLQMCVRW